MVTNKFSITNSKIKSIEKGSIYTSPSNPVIAFNITDTVEGKTVKCILKGDVAKSVWNMFLSDGFTKDSTKVDTTGITVEKEVFISFDADLKEVRSKEVVLSNPTNIKFSFNYKINA